MKVYRPDIDGLRCIAVISVLIYHYGAPIHGGFVGVDVFFVISGYLITKQITEDIAAGRFSILEFYNRRIKRIVPALLLVIAASLVAGWFFLWPGDFVGLGASAASSAVGLGNIYFEATPDTLMRPLRCSRSCIFGRSEWKSSSIWLGRFSCS